MKAVEVMPIKTPLRIKFRTQSSGEEIANSAVHGLMLILVLSYSPILMNISHQFHLTRRVCVLVFYLTVVWQYLTSVMYHFLPSSPAKELFLKLDYAAIFLTIAGTYTALVSNALDNAVHCYLLSVVWAFATTGVMLIMLGRLAHPLVLTGTYVVTGWTVLAASIPLLESMPAKTLNWLLAGGVVYTLGVLFYLLDSRIRYAHSIWHAFVAGGTVFHSVAILTWPR